MATTNRFHALPNEVVDSIFKQIYRISPDMMSDLSLVSKQFNQRATPLLFASIVLSPSKQAAMTVASTSKVKHNVLAHTRDITVKRSLETSLLVDLLGEMVQLKSLRWNCWMESIPNTVLQYVRDNWPEANLYVDNISLGRDSKDSYLWLRDLEMLNSVFECPNVRSIGIHVYHEYEVTLRRLKDVLLSCPNLEELDMRIAPKGHFSNTRFADPFALAFDFDVKPGEKTAPLKKLHITNENTSQSKMLDVKLIPSRLLDLTQLSYLELRGRFTLSRFTALGYQLTSLKILKIDHYIQIYTFASMKKYIDDFKVGIHGLVTFEYASTIQGYSTGLVSMAAQQGETLEQLSIHIPKSSYAGSLGHFSKDHLDTIRMSCANLSSLKLDMHIGEELPYHFLRNIAKFQNLHTLRISTLIEESEFRPIKCAHLETDRKTILHIASFLFGLKTGVPFKEIQILLRGSRDTLTIRMNPRLQSQWRPELNFMCRRAESGRFVITDDSQELVPEV